MHQINPNKLLLSTWTSTSPKQKEKHFIVIKLIRDEQNIVTKCLLEAVMTKKQYTIMWQDLKMPENWRSGWN